MKILILSTNEDNTKLCLIGISFGNMVIGIIFDNDWNY